LRIRVKEQDGLGAMAENMKPHNLVSIGIIMMVKPAAIYYCCLDPWYKLNIWASAFPMFMIRRRQKKFHKKG
jgi:hypothetical protein